MTTKNKSIMTKIHLTEREIELINKHLDGGIEVHSATDEEQDVLGNVIDRANDLMDELDAYDAMDDLEFDLLRWYLTMYEAQK